MFVLKNILPEELFSLLPEELGWGSVMNSIAFSTFSGKRAGRSIGRGGTTGSDVLVLIGLCSTYARGYKVNVARQMASFVEAAPEASQPAQQSKIDVDTTVTILNMGVKFCYRIPTVDLRQVEVQIQNNNSSMTVTLFACFCNAEAFLFEVQLYNLHCGQTDRQTHRPTLAVHMRPGVMKHCTHM